MSNSVFTCRAEMVPTDDSGFDAVQRIYAADCPPDWTNGTRLADEKAETVIAVFRDMARRLDPHGATQIVTTDIVTAHGLVGLARVASIEASQTPVQIILSAPVPQAALLNRLAVSPDAVFVDWRGQAPLVRRFEAADVPAQTPAWVWGGHLVVTGGNGAIAHLIGADILARGEGSALTLVGRGDASEKTRALMADWRQAGLCATWITHSGDRHRLASDMAIVREQAGPVRGILHCAGVNADRLLTGEALPDAEAARAAKLKLAADVDAVTKDDPLATFIGFSSLASVAGNEGQAVYAYANGLLDGFLHNRQEQARSGARQGRSVTVNWGYWEDGGMQLGPATLDTLFRRDGVIPMETDDALKTLRHILTQGDGQFVVAAGDGERIQARLNRPAFTQTRGLGPASAELTTAITAKLAGVLAAATGHATQGFDVDESFATYGVDSLMIVDVMKRLHPMFGDLPRALMFEHGSVARMAGWLVQNRADDCAKWACIAPAPVAAKKLVANTAKVAPSQGGSDIVIVGMGGCFPAARDVAEFWEKLQAGYDAVVTVPADRWDVDALFDPDPAKAKDGFSYARWGGFLDGFADFDPAFFGMTPREALLLDSQERLFLMAAWHALEDAGLTRGRLASDLGGRVGVFAGVTKSDHDRLGERVLSDGSKVYARSSFSSVANRVSFTLGLCGPSYAVDTMCSSSLTAIHSAREAVVTGQCGMALVGGVNLYQHPSSFVELCQSSMLSSDGQCRSFGTGANGFVPGEGAACIVMTTREVANTLGLRIDAVLRSAGINHGGAANGYTVPNPAAQRALVRSVLDDSGFSARDIGYVEAHGTGTALGDPIEVESLTEAFRADTADNGFCHLGSVKSNIGHLEAAAGVTGVIKAVLQMRAGVLVPTLHSDQANPDIDFGKTPFGLVHQCKKWAGPKRAIVNSFGAGGANACVVLEGEAATTDPAPIQQANVLLLSARSRDALLRQARRLLDWLHRPVVQPSGDVLRDLVAQLSGLDRDEITDDLPLAELGLSGDDLRRIEGQSGAAPISLTTCLGDLSVVAGQLVDIQALCFTLQTGREAMPVRVALPVSVGADPSAVLTDFLNDPESAFQEVAKKDRAKMAALRDHPDFQATLQALYDAKDAGRLAGLWGKGLEPDWRQLYRDQPHPLSLPVYPFEARRLWLGDLPLAGALEEARLVKSVAAPELQAALTTPEPVAARVTELLSQTMDLAPEDIHATLSFADFGIDSILGMRFVDAINKAFGSDLRPTVLFDHPDLSSLVVHLKSVGLAAPVAQTPVPAVVQKQAVPEPTPTDAIAIIAQSGRYADADDLDSFWRNLMDGHCAVHPVTRWSLPEGIKCRTGGFLDRIDRFDASFFNISGAEARFMDPQQRLFLEEGWHALEQAGYVGASMSRARCGVYIGCYTGDYQDLFTGQPSSQSLWGNMGSVIPARIAYHLDLTGPAVAFDTACSSSLVAVDAACNALRHQEVDMALAGGVFLQVTPRLYLSGDKAGMLSPTGQSYSFDARADGFVPGEGIGVVVLKRLSDALTDGDVILATIEGSAVNSNGKTNGITAPSQRSQAALLRDCQEAAGVPADRISLVEAHGTGTALGDPIEFEALHEVFGDRRFDPVILTSVKPAIGHSNFAAGIASLHKVVLSMRNGAVPPNLWFDDVNPLIDLAGAGFDVPRIARPWVSETRRFAGVSSFGASGTNAHVIVGEAPEQRKSSYVRSSYPIVLSARSLDGLTALLRSMRDWCDANGDAQIGDVAFTLLAGRRHFENRMAFVAGTIADLRGAIDDALASRPREVQGEFKDICSAFLAGEDFDVASVFAGDQPRRLHLPGAVFERRSFWALDNSAEDAALFTVHRSCTLAFDVRVPDHSPLLQDHKIQGAPVLPGLAVPEIIRAAIADLLGYTPETLTIRDLAWLKTVDVRALAALSLSFGGAPDLGETSFRFASTDGDYVRGVVSLADAAPSVLVQVEKAPSKPVDPEEIATTLRDAGILHGAQMRALTALEVTANGAKGCLSSPAKKVPPLSPVLLDSAVQAATAFDDAMAATLPFSVGEIILHHPMTAEMTVSLNRPRRLCDGTVAGLDIDLYDASGILAVSLRGVTARPIPADEKPENRTFALVPIWSPVAGAAAGQSPAPDVVFHTPDAVVPAHVWPKARRCALSEAVVRAGDTSIALWIDQVTDDSARAEKILVKQCFDLIRSTLAAGGESMPTAWRIITRSAIAVSPQPGIGVGASLAGLFGSLSKEYPHWSVACADIDGPEWFDPAMVAFGTQRVLRNGIWMEQSLRRLSNLPEAGDQPVYRDGAVYVVIGGAGGVARQWTDHVLHHATAQVVWLGRSAPDGRLQDCLDAVPSDRPTPAYIQVDARDKDALTRVRQDILRQYGRIDGVVHSAIVLDDGGFATMTWDRMEQVLAAKIDTLVNMVDVFGQHMTDFGALFSSLQSFARMPGQGNYAAACTFADNYFLHEARALGLRLSVVNWGYWADAGIVATDDHKQRMQRFGQLGLNRDRAFAALDAVLGGAPDQIAIAELADGAVVAMEDQAHGADPAETRVPDVLHHMTGLVGAERWTAVEDRVGNQMDRFDPAMVRILAASLKAAGLATPSDRSLISAMPKVFDKWWPETERVLTAAGYLDATGVLTASCPKLDEALQGWDRSVTPNAGDPDLKDQIRLADAMLRGLPDILRGDRAATEIMFPAGRFDLVNGVYRGNAVVDYFNDLLADGIDAAVQARIALNPSVKLRIVEVGAGTGGTARTLFRRLRPYRGNIGEYLFTDMSRSFLISAKQAFAADAPYLKTALFDARHPPERQGLDVGCYDIAVATNCLHATPDVCQSLLNAKQFLARNGMIFVNELVRKSLFSHLTFGLLEGWWAFDDGEMRQPGTAILSSRQWHTAFDLTGFTPAIQLCAEAEVLNQQVFAARSDGMFETLRDAPVVAPVAEPPAPAVVDFASQNSRPTVAFDLPAYLTRIIAEIIEVDADSMKESEAFERYGVDSILVLQIVDALRPDFPKITSTVLFEFDTIARLSAHLGERFPNDLTRLGTTDVDLMPSEPAVAPNAAPLPATVPQKNARDIAIIGMSGRFAGCDDLDAFWSLLRSGGTQFSEGPRDGRDWPAEGGKPAGFLNGADRFDPLFFAISPAEAVQMDPQERLFLETAYHAIENAGYAPSRLSKTGTVSVFVGIMNAHYPTRAAFWSAANRLSFLFDFKGTSMACDTACSSSLSALYLAMETLRSGRSDVAIAGGVNIISHPRHIDNLDHLGILSRSGQSLPFAEDANGMLSGEGVGVVVLKRLDRALADGDRIDGVLRGAALNSGGRSSSYTAPNPAAHADVIGQALADAELAPTALSLVEAHGTGTRLGDPIEVEGLRRALKGVGNCALGSVKGNIGHCESAAGMAGLFKILLQMKHAQIVPQPVFGALNPEIDLDEAGLYVPRSLTAWDAPDGGPRVAGLSSFGAGGANSHVVIQEPPHAKARVGVDLTDYIVPLSARTAEQLATVAGNILACLDGDTPPTLAELAFTLQTGRDSLAYRRAFVVQEISQLRPGLGQVMARAATIKAIDPKGETARPTYEMTAQAIADAWMDGADVDWHGLWAGCDVKRVALPEYPFGGTSYWLAETPVTKQTDRAPEPQLSPAAVVQTGAMIHLLERVVSEVLHLSRSELDVDTPLENYGLDSVMVIRATERLEQDLGPLSRTLFYEHRTLRDLAAHLETDHDMALAPKKYAPPTEDPIAIIGLAGRYPQGESLDAFWQALRDGRDCITEIPADRWDHSRFYSDRKEAGKTRSRWGGFLNGVDRFDARFFGILPEDAELSDPQERLFLEQAWHALEDSGHCPESLSAAGKVGVFVGVMYSDYQLFGAEETARGRPTALSANPASIANRVSYTLDFKGPSIAIDTMCASSLTAIHLAVKAIRAEECTAAVAGGVNLTLHPNKYLMMAHGGFEASDGRCRSFGTGGTGYVPSEGVGAIVLKPLSKALADGDPIRGVIRGTAINHGGRANGFTVPDPVAQSQAIGDALADAGIAPSRVSYIECHGTGTALGDPIEITGLKRVFGTQQELRLGSVKSNIGHCESAAGVAGLTKLLLQMENRTFVPSIHADVLNPDLGLDGTGFTVQRCLAPWQGTGQPLVAGISSFGAGGSNAHLVIEEAPERMPLAEHSEPVAFVISAMTEPQLCILAADMARHLRGNSQSLLGVAYTLQTGRRALKRRAGFLANTREEAIRGFEALAAGTQVRPPATGPQASALAQWLNGAKVDWAVLYPHPPLRVHLPLYPFERQAYWGVATEASDMSPYPVAEETQVSDPVVTSAKLDDFQTVLFAPEWAASPAVATHQEAGRTRLLVDLTGGAYAAGCESIGIAGASPADICAAMVDALGPVAARTAAPDMVQFLLPAGDPALASAVAGFAGTLTQERKQIATQVIEVGQDMDAARIADCLAQDARTSDRLVRYQGGARLVRGLRRISAASEVTLPTGTVVISGGFGGLGQLITEDIVRRSPAIPVALLGRRPLDRQIAAFLQSLGSTRLTYHSVDITDATAVAETINQIRGAFGPVSTVIHAAGVLRDGMLMAKSPSDAKTVAATKIAGAQALDAATRDDPLDAFVLCSSLAGVSGNVGQADYAFANGWLDGFAAARGGRGRTVSLNWPLWADGGMSVPASVEREMLDGFGLAPLSKEQGLSVLWQSMGMQAPQIVVAFGRADRIMQRLDNGSALRPAASVAPEPGSISAVDRPKQILVELVSDILRLPPDHVCLDDSLSDLGFDSISLADLADKFGRKVGQPISAALFFSAGTLRQACDEVTETLESCPVTAPQAPEPVKAPVGATLRITSAPSRDAIAVVGMSGAFPGARSLDEFWRNLREGRRVVQEVPSDRWDWRAIFGDPKKGTGKTDIKWGGFLDDIGHFDPLFFGISPREAESMDPHQRLLLTHAWSAIEDAGIAPASLSGTETAVFTATAASEYAAMAREDGLILQQQSSSGSVGCIGPNRISSFLNLNGPSEPVETACSSALVALHRGVEAIRNGCEAALVGAVNTILMPHGHISFARSGMLSPEGQCRSFSGDADGYVRSEGAAMIVLMPLNRAVERGLPVYGVIRATGVNHGGRSVSLFAPNAEAQGRLIARVLGQSGIDPATISAIEAHGTGTPVGDPIEFAGLKRGFEAAGDAYGGGALPADRIALSSVKSHIGHCEMAAGLAGLIKVLLQMRHGVLVPDKNRKGVNPAIDTAGTPFYFVDEAQPWARLSSKTGEDIPRRAGISSFGYGGVNAHVIVEEYVPAVAQSGLEQEEVIVLSAQSATGLEASVRALLAWLDAHPNTGLDQIAATLQTGRNALRHRLAFTAKSLADLQENLGAWLAGRDVQGLVTGIVRAKATGTDQIPHGLAAAWVAGAPVDWPDRPSGLLLLNLPATAMDMRRYWFETSKKPEALSLVRADGDGRYVTGFDSSASFVQDHVVQGEPVLPGTAYLEIVRGAGAAYLGEGPLYIRNLTFEQKATSAIVEARMTVRMTPKDGAGAQFEIESGSMVFSRGEIGHLAGDAAPTLDLDQIRARTTDSISGDEIYAVFRDMGLDYGPSFRLISEAHGGDGIFVSRVRQNLSADAPEAGLHCPPNIVDAALHSTIGISLVKSSDEIDLHLPVLIREIDVYARLGTEVVVVVRETSGSSKRGSDISLCDPDGRVCVEIRGFVTARIGVTARVGRYNIGTQIAMKADAPIAAFLNVTTEATEQIIQEAVSHLTNIDVADIDPDIELSEFGLDSVSFAELAELLSARLGRQVDPVVFFECPTIAELSAHLTPMEPASAPTMVEGMSAADIVTTSAPATAPLQQRVQQQVFDMVAAVVHLDTGVLDEETEFSDIGLDSIAFAEIARQLEAIVGQEVLPVALYECATLGGLVDMCCSLASAVAEQGVAMDQSPEPEPVTQKSVAQATVDRTELERDVLRLVSRLVHVPLSDLDPDAPLSDFGLESGLYAELGAQLTKRFGVEFDPHQFYGFLDIHGLTDVVAEAVKPTASDPVAQPHEPPMTPPASEPVGKVHPALNPARQDAAADEGFAIIGMSAAFPGARNVDEFWTNMVEGRDVISRPPSWRWDWRAFERDPRQTVGRTNVNWGGFIDGLEEFAPAFFGFSAAEAELMDPQQRLMFMHVWSALEDAGYAPKKLGGSKTGIYCGIASQSYGALVYRAGRQSDPRWVMGNVASMTPNRISHMLDLHGPSEPVETACSSSLVALHRAVEDLRDGICEMAIVGGVNAIATEDLHMAFAAAGMLSPDGRCKTFDKDANGYVRSEGIGAVIVRRVSDALRDGDNILGVVKATGVRHAGRATSLTAPNPKSQAELIEEVVSRSGVDPATISYVEAHGTGTALGDPIEVEGLKSAFATLSTGGASLPEAACAIGAAKTHVGHLEVAAGMAGLIKVLLQMRERKIVANLNCKGINPMLRLDGSPFRLAMNTEPWIPEDRNGAAIPMRACISSFGFGGVNAHLVVEEAPTPIAKPVDTGSQAIVLSAETETALVTYADRLAEWVDGHMHDPAPDLLARIARTLQDGRDPMKYRLALVTENMRDLRDRLRAWADQKSASSVWHGKARPNPIFQDAEEMAILMDNWVRKNDLARACSVWVNGAAINWTRFRKLNPRRIALPSYPFECGRYWVTPLDTVVEHVASPGPKVALAPPAMPLDQGPETVLRGVIATYLGVDQTELDLSASFGDLGFDSIGIMTVVSRFISGVSDLKLDKFGDQLLQASGPQAMLDLVEGWTTKDEPAADPLRLDLYVQSQKKNSSNLVITRPILHTGPSVRAAADLLIDEEHPLFFDHPLDHVSGLHLAESMCQLARATELFTEHQEPRVPVFLKKLRFDFLSGCAKASARVSVRRDGLNKHSYRGAVVQNDAVSANGELVFDTFPDLDWSALSRPLETRRIRKGRVNKSHAENVLLADFNADEDRFHAHLSVSPKADFYCDFVGPALDSIVILEAVRQMMRAISTRQKQASLKTMAGWLKHMEVTLDRPVAFGESLKIVADTNSSFAVGGAALLAVQGTLASADSTTPIGTFSVAGTAVSADLLQVWGKLQKKTARD